MITTGELSVTDYVKARNAASQLSSDAMKIAAHTEMLQNPPGGDEGLHQMVIDYATKQYWAEDEVEALYINHTRFLRSFKVEIGFLSMRVEEGLGHHGSMESVCSWIPGSHGYTALGRMMSDFQDFAELRRSQSSEYGSRQNC